MLKDGTIIHVEMLYDDYCELENDAWNTLDMVQIPVHYFEQGDHRSVFQFEDDSAVVLDFEPDWRHMVIFNAPRKHDYLWTHICVWCLPK